MWNRLFFLEIPILRDLKYILSFDCYLSIFWLWRKEIFSSLLWYIWHVCEQLLGPKNFDCILELLCIQTRDWKKDELNIWLIPSHIATWPPSSSYKNYFDHIPPSSLVSESRLICIEWEFDCLLLHLLLLLSPLYRENEQWISVIFSVIILLASDVFVWLNSPLSLNSPLKRKGWNIKNDRWGLSETHY